MPVVHGLFADGDRAVAAIETLRTGRFPTDHMRLIAGPRHAAEFAASAATTNLSAGPTEPLVSGALDKYVQGAKLTDLERRIDEGAVLLLAEDLEGDEANRLSSSLREQGAQDVEVVDA
jgi:hypothetical protein